MMHWRDAPEHIRAQILSTLHDGVYDAPEEGALAAIGRCLAMRVDPGEASEWPHPTIDMIEAARADDEIRARALEREHYVAVRCWSEIVAKLANLDPWRASVAREEEQRRTTVAERLAAQKQHALEVRAQQIMAERQRELYQRALVEAETEMESPS